MTKEQQLQLTKFLALFAYLLKEGSAPRNMAELVMQAAASCMIGAVFNIGEDHPESEGIADFARRAIDIALRLQYEPESVERVPLQA